MGFMLKKFVSYWLMPLPFCVVLILAGTILLFRPRAARFGRGLVAAGLMLLMLFGNTHVSRALIRPLETRYDPIPAFGPGDPVPAAIRDCRYVVLLGGGNGFSPGMSATNLLSSSALSRTTEAVRILHALPQAKLIVTGPASGDRPSHASILARAAGELGIPPGRILHLDQGRDTEDEARAVKLAVGDAPVALATSAWHLPRAMALFERAGVRAVACPSDYKSHAEGTFHLFSLLWDLESLDRSTMAVRERLGGLWVKLKGGGS